MPDAGARVKESRGSRTGAARGSRATVPAVDARMTALLARGEEVRLPAKTTSFLEWAGRLSAHAAAPALREQLPRWVAEAREPVARLPRDGDGRGPIEGGKSRAAGGVAGTGTCTSSAAG